MTLFCYLIEFQSHESSSWVRNASTHATLSAISISSKKKNVTRIKHPTSVRCLPLSCYVYVWHRLMKNKTYRKKFRTFLKPPSSRFSCFMISSSFFFLRTTRRVYMFFFALRTETSDGVVVALPLTFINTLCSANSSSGRTRNKIQNPISTFHSLHSFAFLRFPKNVQTHHKHALRKPETYAELSVNIKKNVFQPFFITRAELFFLHMQFPSILHKINVFSGDFSFYCNFLVNEIFIGEGSA